MEKSQSIIVFVLVFLIQVILNNSVFFGIYLYPVPICFVLLSRDVRTSSLNMLLTAFGTGILLDFLSNGVPGLNAAALTAMAFFRRPVLKRLFLMYGGAEYNCPSVWNMGMTKYLIYSIITCASFFIFYVSLESVGITGLWIYLKRILAGTFVNAAVMLMMSAAIQKRRTF